MVGRGGEGSVWDIPSKPNFVAKIYHNPPTPERADKLRAMVKIKNNTLTAFAAWPAGLLYKKSIGPIGLIMPKVSTGKKSQTL